MKTKKFTLGMAVSLLMMTAGMHDVSAQDNDMPWHVTVYNSDTVEIASFNVEALEDIALSTDGATVTFKLDNGKQFPYPAATALFGFEPRPQGSGTANGAVEINPRSVRYANGILHLSEAAAADGNIYNMAGMRIKTFARGQKDIPVNLPGGLYIVQSGMNTAKLFVNRNGTGGAIATPQPAAAPTKQAAAYSTVTTRAAEAFKVWMNITHGDANHIQKTPIQMDLVAYWKFTIGDFAIGIEFLMKDGNIIKINEFRSIVFEIRPAPPQTDGWDMEKTVKFGGASYVYDFGDNIFCDISIIAVTKDYVVAEGLYKKIPTIKVLKKDITNPDFWTGKLTILYESSENLTALVQFYKEFTVRWWIFYDIYNIQGRLYGYATDRVIDFNNGTPAIPTTTTLNADGNVTMEFTDVRDGTKHSHTFRINN